MIRIRLGQSWAPRSFVERCARIEAEPRLTRVSGRQQRGAQVGVSLTAEWGEPYLGLRTMMFVLTVGTKQRLGGERRWWVCPDCGRRCRVLLSPEPRLAFTCRKCLRAVYLTDYPSRSRVHRLRQFLGLARGGPFDLWDEADRLLAPRKRGVRRGRRVRERGLRATQRALDELNAGL